jgi:predicted DNA-binding transcriptional regulator YafY
VTRPTARVLALLEILEGGGTHTAADLAARLDVDERTVRRYIGHLLDLEIPVEPVHGRYGGYRLSPGFRMPPLMLTDEEALAVVLGLASASPSEPAASATAKVRRVLPKTLAARLEALLATTDFTGSAPGKATPEAAVMLVVADATRRQRPLAISYADRSGRRSERTVFPYGLVAHNGRWYLSGGDSVSGETRTFRLDRVSHARLADGAFTVPDGFRAAEAVLTSLSETPWRHEVEFAVRGEPDAVRAKLPPGLATVSDDAAGWVRVRLRAESLDWLPGLLAGLGLPFVIHRPAELRDLTRAWAERIAGYCE